MFLNEGNVLLYLVKQRFVSINDAVSGAFTVRSLSRRNRNFWVNAGDRHFFVKQAARWSTAARSTVDAEAAWYRQIQLDGTLMDLKYTSPACFAYDPSSSALILEYFPEYLPVYESKHRFETNAAQIIGRMIADVHARTAAGQLKQTFFDVRPWVFSMHSANENSLENPSGGRRELIRTIRNHREFAKLLEKIQEQWRPQCLVHGDCKLENWLIDQDGTIRLIDWECIVWGDPAWDVATALQSYWNFHVRWPRLHRPEKIRPALRAFIEGYRHARTLPCEQLLDRVIPFAGARMLQSAFEAVERSDALTPRAVRLLQAALNVMTRPEWAAGYFLGGDWQTSATN